MNFLRKVTDGCHKTIMPMSLAVTLLSVSFTANAVTLKINPDAEYQGIDGFGASDCWTMQWLGLWPDSARCQVADWLFSQENDSDGQPLGIGLSMWRFNVGAGSQEQGEDSQIYGLWNRQEGFLVPDGSAYDWDKLKGQRWFLRQAVEQGVPVKIAFLNSPPVQMTENGLATNTGRGGTLNLKADCYEPFAQYLADVVEGVAQHDGITFDYLCPVNEPDGHWNWLGPKQEGSPATNRELAKVVRLTGKEFQRRGLPTQILVNESSDYRCMYSTHVADWQRGYAIQALFTPDSIDTYVGDVPNVAKIMAGHSYWTNTPMWDLKAIRDTLRDTIASRGIGFWQTEVCIMGNDDELNGGGGFDRSMKTALYVARVIHHDMVRADARSWSWWRAAGGNYKDGLIYMEPSRDLLSGQVYDSKLMWALGNYSRFVRPGAVRIDVSRADGLDITDPVGLMASAYKNPDNSLAIVVVNYADEDLPLALDLTQALSQDSTQVIAVQPYLTSKGDANLKPLPPFPSSASTIIPARSIVTYLLHP